MLTDSLRSPQQRRHALAEETYRTTYIRGALPMARPYRRRCIISPSASAGEAANTELLHSDAFIVTKRRLFLGNGCVLTCLVGLSAALRDHIRKRHHHLPADVHQHQPLPRDAQQRARLPQALPGPQRSEREGHGLCRLHLGHVQGH